MTPAPTRVEWCVCYRRTDWLPTTCDRRKVFTRLADAEAFVRKLYAGGRPDLSPPTGVRIERRQVTAWEAHR